VPPSSGHVTFEWTAARHFAAADHLAQRSKAKRRYHFAASLAVWLLMMTAFAIWDERPFVDQLVQLLVFSVGFAVVSAAFWAIFTWPRGRRLFFRRASAIACSLAFDERGVAWLLGKQRLFYPWSKVRSVDEDSDHIFVLASTAFCLAIPKSAFGSPLEAEYFAANMRDMRRAMR
jgi:hypothetical protein